MNKPIIPGSGSSAEASQNEQIRRHLEAGGTITQLEAFRRFGCLRLSGRIYDLTHKEGLSIRSEMVRHGNKRVARYSLQTN